ncbi:MAG: PhnE/PtxC family ABC transporter permease [bacterium]
MKRRFLRNRNLVIILVLALGFAWSFTGIQWNRPLTHPQGLSTMGEFLLAMVTPELSPSILILGLKASWRTLVFATCGMTLAVVIGFPLGVLASGTLARETRNQWFLTGMIRPVLGFMRSIHELVWAWLFVAALGLAPLAAIFAILIPYAGILGRILADLLNDVPEEPLRSLRSAGASELQVLLYGRIPYAVADIVSYTLYRFECAIRSAAIMSFIGLGGLGYQIEISLADLKFSEAWTFVYCLIALVLFVNIWSSETRRALTTQ